MSGALYLPGADRTSRWFFKAGAYPNQVLMPRIDKTLLHSTETPKTSGCPGYSGGANAPQLTLNPWKGYRKITQHFPLNRAGRALMNPSSTPVSENKDNVVQIEIIGYSDPALGRKYGCYLPDLTDDDLDWLAEQIALIHREWPHPTTLPSTWPLYKVSSWAAMNAARMSSAQYDAHRGILAHLHASGNTHGDVALNIRALKAKVDSRLGAAPTPPTPRTVLRPGDRGDDVKALQVLLIAAGADIVADGSYGPATEAAVRAFQTTSGLDVDGIAGPATRTALKAPTPTPPAPTQEVAAVFMVKRKDADPVFKSDGFRRVHIDKVQRDALLSAGVKLHDHFTTDAQLDAFGPVFTITPGVTS